MPPHRQSAISKPLHRGDQAQWRPAYRRFDKKKKKSFIYLLWPRRRSSVDVSGNVLCLMSLMSHARISAFRVCTAIANRWSFFSLSECGAAAVRPRGKMRPSDICFQRREVIRRLGVLWLWLMHPIAIYFDLVAVARRGTCLCVTLSVCVCH